MKPSERSRALMLHLACVLVVSWLGVASAQDDVGEVLRTNAITSDEFSALWGAPAWVDQFTRDAACWPWARRGTTTRASNSA